MSMVDIGVFILQNRWGQVAIALLILEEVIRHLKPKLKGTSGEAMVSMILFRLPKDKFIRPRLDDMLDATYNIKVRCVWEHLILSFTTHRMVNVR